MSERAPDVLPDLAPLDGGLARLLAKREALGARHHAIELAVPAGILAVLVLAIVGIEAGTSVDVSAIEAEIHGHASVATRDRAIEQPTSRPDVRVYAIETGAAITPPTR